MIVKENEVIICKECGSRCWEATDGSLIPYERVIETELKYLKNLVKKIRGE